MVLRRLAIILLLVGASCGSHADPAPTGRLVVQQQAATGGPLYVEGYVPFVKITFKGTQVLDESMRLDNPVRRDLEPGRYQLTFTVRPCDANCGFLGPVDETCSASFDIESGRETTVSITVKPTVGCTIAIA